LYVTFPPEAGEPPAQLKAFQAVRLEPDDASEVGMEMPVDDLAIFGDGSRSRLVPGMYEIQLGVSSADLRLNAAVQVP
jgi:beta-glucosidase